MTVTVTVTVTVTSRAYIQPWREGNRERGRRIETRIKRQKSLTEEGKEDEDNYKKAKENYTRIETRTKRQKRHKE